MIWLPLVILGLKLLETIINSDDGDMDDNDMDGGGEGE